MGLFDWLKKRNTIEEKNIIFESSTIKINSKGLTLTTFNQMIHEPTIEQIKEAIVRTINAFDEFILLEWVEEHDVNSFVQGIGFGETYRLEYVPVNGKEGYAYVKEGVSLKDTEQYLLTFQHHHQIVIDASWKWQQIV